MHHTNHSSTVSQDEATTNDEMTAYKLVLQSAGTLDYETKRQYALGITVTDGILVDQATVNVQVLNVNDVTVDDVTVLSADDGTTMETPGNQRYRSLEPILASFMRQMKVLNPSLKLPTEDSIKIVRHSGSRLQAAA